MRVLHALAGNLYGGVESMVVTLCREQAACPSMHPEVAVCFKGRLATELERLEVKVHDLGPVSFRRPWQLLRARARLQTLLRGASFDAVVAHGCWPYVLVAPTVHAAGARRGIFLHDRAKGRHWLERWARRSAPDVILVNSRFTEESVEALFPRRSAAVLHPPVSPASPAGEGVRDRLRASLGAQPSDTVILLAARLERWKGHELLIDALARLAGSPGWRCWIAGGPQRPAEERYLAELRARLERHGLSARVRLLGQRSDVRELLEAADVLCQPNTGPEPFGVAYVEALWAGRPVVTTAQGGALEVVDATCGVLVPPDDASALATSLARLIEEPALRGALGRAGPARASALCDPTRQLERLRQTLACAGPR